MEDVMHTNKTSFEISDGKEHLNIVLNKKTAEHLISVVDRGMKDHLSDGCDRFYISVLGSSITL